MAGSVKLTVVEGRQPGLEFVYTERTTCIVGRADDCAPRFLDEGRTQLVSRHHCLIDINPPDVRIRDFGGRNGTHVNDQEIGRRREGQTPEEGARLRFRERDLVDGDRIRLGTTVIRVGVSAPVGPAPTRR